MTESKNAGRGEAATGRVKRTTVVMILTALFGVLIAMIVGDALIGALVLAMLEFAGVTGPAVNWTEGVLAVASVIPAYFLFRHALANERSMWAPPSDGAA
jgi:hypothetical protein